LVRIQVGQQFYLQALNAALSADFTNASAYPADARSRTITVSKPNIMVSRRP
jgi:hypothetical protein